MSVHYTLKSSGAPFHLDYRGLLNDDQYQAVTAPPGPMLVIAGAGSGKTRTLTYRVAYLVEQGVEPERILLLTFTNKAAREMLRRVGEVLPQDLSGLWGGTFHHIGHRILRRDGERAGLDRNFTIMDQEDAKDVVAACLSDSGLDEKETRFPKAEVLQTIFSLAANSERAVGAVLEEQYPYFTELAEPIAGLASAYEKRKRRIGSVDYDDLLILTLKLLREHDETREHYQARFRHVLVDEYQDTNKVQAELVDLLAAAHRQVMVVGDDAQSIYSWRGADFENILTFPDRYEGCRVVRIETNYRSTPEILALANASIAHNTRQFPKELRAVKAAGVKPALVGVDDSRQQAEFVAQRVLELREEGVDLREIAVLYRSHFHSMELQMELTRRNIPFQITSGLRFFEQAHIKDAAAFLKVAINPRDEVSFKRIALMLPGVGPRSAHKLWTEVAGGAPWRTVVAPPKARTAWGQWAELQEQLAREVAEVPPDRLLQRVVEGFYEDFLKAKYPNYENRMDDLRQLQGFAEEFKETAEFLAQLSLLTNLDTGPAAAPGGDEEQMTLSSVHQAKGLEWKAVFVIMLCDGMFPHARAIEDGSGEEEERRLFYVATTRAREELYLIYPQIHTSRRSFQDSWQRPSRFIAELPGDACNRWMIRRESPWAD